MYLSIVSLTGLKAALVFLFMLLNNTTQFGKFVSQTCMMKTEKVQKHKLLAWQKCTVTVWITIVLHGWVT